MTEFFLIPRDLFEYQPCYLIVLSEGVILSSI